MSKTMNIHILDFFLKYSNFEKSIFEHPMFEDMQIQFEEKNKRDMRKELPQKLKREKKLFYSDHCKLSSWILFENKIENEQDLDLDKEEVVKIREMEKILKKV